MGSRVKKFFSGKMLAVLALCLVLGSATLLAAGEGATVNWADEMISATGYGTPPDRAKNPGHARILARNAAIMDAYRRLAEQAQGIHITAASTVADNVSQNDTLRGQVDAVIKRAKILPGSETYDEYNNCQLMMEVPLYGVSNSLAKVVLQPVEKEAFPEPTTEEGSEAVEGDYTGLIIDCSDVTEDTAGSVIPVAFYKVLPLSVPGVGGLNPVMTPTVRSTSQQAIYGYSNLDHSKVVEKGMVGYATDKKDTARAGKKPLVVKAVKMEDDNSTPVVSEKDANKILRENKSSHFMDDGAVIMLSTKGLRDSYSKRYTAPMNGNGV
ncbi:MAG: LPP20 family lipoprotein [Selenomonadaceae bacterium]|nr:LPP20 family lipoprotein [Selenomonadaceae bacterium]